MKKDNLQSIFFLLIINVYIIIEYKVRYKNKQLKTNFIYLTILYIIFDMKTFINQDGKTENELKEKYNPEGSPPRNLQIEILKMLLWLSDVCKENNIEWYLAYGNILGAVRHGGFIPWDDDLDICLLEKDYKRLKKILLLKNYSDSEYVLQNHKTDKGYFAFWSVLRHKNSEYIKNDRIHNARKYRGFQIDIFPLAEKRLQFVAKMIKKIETINNKYFIGKISFVI